MRFITKLVLEIPEEIDGAYREVERHGYDYTGPYALAKKGSGQLSGNMAWQQQQAQQDAANAAGYNSDVQSLLSELMGSTTPGSLSPAASAMYASDMANINNIYNGLRQNAFASSARRGFGGPIGFQQSAENAVNQSQAKRAGFLRFGRKKKAPISGGSESLFTVAA